MSKVYIVVRGPIEWEDVDVESAHKTRESAEKARDKCIEWGMRDENIEYDYSILEHELEE